MARIFTNIKESEVKQYFPMYSEHDYIYCNGLFNFMAADCKAGENDIILIVDVGGLDGYKSAFPWGQKYE